MVRKPTKTSSHLQFDDGDDYNHRCIRIFILLPFIRT